MNREQEVTIRVSADRVGDDAHHRECLARELGLSSVDGYRVELRRRSLDARGRAPYFLLRFAVFPPGVSYLPRGIEPLYSGLDVAGAESVVIVGMGPAGMFAALRLLQLGFKPIVLERGKSVRARRRDLAAITKRGEVNPESNYCFGEGGAGTFSDGKLYTRSTKRGSVERILRIFVEHGASPDILVDAHPHIGTNKLPQVVEAIRETILRSGGEVHFNSAVEGLLVRSGAITGVQLQGGATVDSRAVILATGHSARDVYLFLHRHGIGIERKSFAVGVRVEHPQPLIDAMQYRISPRPAALPPAAYAFVAQCGGRGVFSFCMCPGGIICPAATSSDEVVVNGWSPSRRNSPYANSGVVVEVHDEDLAPYFEAGPLAGVGFQHALETKAALLGGGKQVAPAQRLTDLLNRKRSSSLPKCSYLPGLRSCELAELFPESIFSRLSDGFRDFEGKRRGYISAEAVVVGVESRTSSPVRIPRDPITRFHPDVIGFAPCGEGAGYAGGIVSAAMDGESSAEAVARFLRPE